MMGPFAAADAHTEVVKTHKIVPIPHFIAGMWLPEPDGITAHYFWEIIYPVSEKVPERWMNSDLACSYSNLW